MPNIAQISNPSLYAEGPGSNNPAVQKDPVTEAASQSWLAGSFVYTSGTGASVVLSSCVTQHTQANGVYGLCPDSAVGTGATTPPARLFGNRHYPFDVRQRHFAINIAGTSTAGAEIGTTSGVTWAGGGTGGVALAPGQQYGLLVPATGAYAGMQFLCVTNTTSAQKLFEIVSLHPDYTTTDYSPRVIVKIVDAAVK